MITAFGLRLIAIITMFIDHMGYKTFDDLLVLRIIGRIAFPLFAFGIAEGITYTNNYKKYLSRLFVLALISEIPYDLFLSDNWFYLESSNAIFTLLAGACICCLFKFKLNTYEKILLIVTPVAICFMNSDYGIIGIISIPIMYYFMSKGRKILGVLLSCLLLGICYGYLQMFCLLAVIPVALYSGKKSDIMKTDVWRILNYSFYPFHMFVIYIMKYISMR